jgi:NAD(P)-dependent dehydrogenase (short-subunit alcohol dehydrogenase family)
VSALKAAQPSASISYILMDLANLQSVRDAAAAWLDSGKQIDVLLNNAGATGGSVTGGSGSRWVKAK